MQTVEMQFETMNNAVEECGKITSEDLIRCVGAVNTAHKEILLFLQLNFKLTS